VAVLDLGRLNLFVALFIATIKAFLVALYFMHLRYDRPLHGVIFLFGLFFVMLFVGLVLMDSAAYGPELIQGYAPGIQGD
jgi:cytochrome c oxidase subunit 4